MKKWSKWSAVSVLILITCVFVAMGSIMADAAGGYEPSGFAFSGKVFLIGDSTVSYYSETQSRELGGRFGWGMKLAGYFNNVTVENLAIGGTSSRTFIQQENYKKLEENLGKGDYLFIQFGHNDEYLSSTYRCTYPSLDPETLDSEGKNADGHYSYEFFLTKYIDLAREKEAVPVLVTPITFLAKNGGAVYLDHIEYRKAMIALGQKLNVPVMDMTMKTAEVYDDLYNSGKGSETFKFHCYTDATKTTTDRVHLSSDGADLVASLIAKETESLGLSLCKNLKETSTQPGNSEEPGNTEEPGSNEEPGKTEEPGNNEEPGKTEEPGNNEEPGKTEDPDNNEEPKESEIPEFVPGRNSFTVEEAVKGVHVIDPDHILKLTVDAKGNFKDAVITGTDGKADTAVDSCIVNIYTGKKKADGTDEFFSLVFSDGKWDTSYDSKSMGAYRYEGESYMAAGGVINQNANGLQYTGGAEGWKFLAAGKVVRNKAGLVMYQDQWFWIDANGSCDQDYAAIVKWNGADFLVHGGRLRTDYTGFSYDPLNRSKWYHIENGQVWGNGEITDRSIEGGELTRTVVNGIVQK